MKTTMQYQTKPKKVEAFQLTHEAAFKSLNKEEPLPFGLSASGQWHPVNRTVSHAYVFLPEHEKCANLGDWIVKNEFGICHPMKDEDFQKNYEPTP